MEEAFSKSGANYRRRVVLAVSYTVLCDIISMYWCLEICGYICQQHRILVIRVCGLW